MENPLKHIKNTEASKTVESEIQNQLLVNMSIKNCSTNLLHPTSFLKNNSDHTLRSKPISAPHAGLATHLESSLSNLSCTILATWPFQSSLKEWPKVEGMWVFLWIWWAFWNLLSFRFSSAFLPMLSHPPPRWNEEKHMNSSTLRSRLR